MKFYYAIFKRTKEAVEVEFPDLPGCVTFGDNFDEAFENATDALAGWLANADQKFVSNPTTYDTLKKKYPRADLIPIPVDEKIMESYEELKRFNVIFPAGLLQKVDRFRKQKGLKRSTLLKQATEEYLNKHE